MEYFDNTDLRVFYFTPFRNNKNRFFYFVYTTMMKIQVQWSMLKVESLWGIFTGNFVKYSLFCFLTK